MNSAELLADVKRKAQIEDGQDTLTDSDILDLATKELQTVITPKILSVRENFLATYKDYTLSSIRTYRLPSSSTGDKILAVEVIETGSSQRRRLVQIDMMENPAREGFYIRSGSIVLSDFVATTGTLRIHYCARPGALTETVKYVASLSDNNTAVMSAAHGISTNYSVSFQRSDSPFEYVAQNLIVTAATPTDLTFAENLSTLGVGLGDMMTITATDGTAADALKESKAFIPQIPLELHDWLSYRVACRVLEHLGHQDLLEQKIGKVGDIEKDLLALISPRVDKDGKIIFEKELLGDVWW